MIEKKEEYVARLYGELFNPQREFCMGISWLMEDALASDDSNRFELLWEIYLALMTKVGAEMFAGDVCWNTHSEQIEPVFDMLFHQGYSNKIIQLILGVNNLMIQIKPNGYSYTTSKLREIVNQYYAIIQSYVANGVLNIEDGMAKWDFIDISNRFFGVAYDIVEEYSKPAKSLEQLRAEQERQEEMRRGMEDKLDEWFGGLEHPICHRIKRSFKKLFSKKKR